MSGTSRIFPIHVGLTAPSNTTGRVVWNNTNAGVEGTFFRDQTRNKWLGEEKIPFNFGRDSADNVLLRTNTVNNSSTGSGYWAPQDCTLVNISCNAGAGNQTKGIEIQVNGVAVYSFNMVAGVGLTSQFQDKTLDLDISNGDLVTAFAVAAGGGITDLEILLYGRPRA